MRLHPIRFQMAIAICAFQLFVGISALQTQEINLKTNLEAKGKLNSNSYGFTTEFMFNAAAEEVDNEFRLKENVYPILDEIAPNLLRFPSGTISNFYHYYDPGYGIDIKELPDQVAYKQSEKDKDYTKNFIIPFAETARATKSEVLYVVNLRSHFFPIDFKGYELDTETERFKYLFKENMDAIQYLLDNNVNIVGIELGNENYLGGVMTINFKRDSLQGLIDLSKLYTDSIKHYWPKLKVGVPLPIPESGASRLQQIFIESYMKHDFYDAFIIHPYLPQIDNDCPESMEKEAFFKCATQYAESYFDNSLAYLENEFFPLLLSSHKKIWLTEWNLNSPLRLSNNFFHATYIFRLFNMLLDMDCDLGSPIEYMNFHSIMGDVPNYPTIAPWIKSKESDTIVVHEEYVYKAAHYAVRLFKDLLNNDFHKVDNELTLESGSPSDDFHNWTYFDQDQGHLKFYFYNNSHIDISLNLAESSYGDNLPVKNATMSYVRANAIYDFAGVNHDNRNIDDLIGNQLRIHDNIILNPTQTLTIPRLTIGCIDIILDQSKITVVDTVFVEEENCKHFLSIVPSLEGGNTKYNIARFNSSNESFETIQDIYIAQVDESPLVHQIEIDDPYEGDNQYLVQVFQHGELIDEFFINQSFTCISEADVDFSLSLAPTITTNKIKARITSSGLTIGKILITELYTGEILEQEVILKEGLNRFDFNMMEIQNAVAGYYTFTISIREQAKSKIFLFFP